MKATFQRSVAAGMLEARRDSGQAVRLSPGESTRLFAVTNHTGNVFSGWIELAAPGEDAP